MCSAVSSTDGVGGWGEGSDIFLISAQYIDAGESQGESHTWLFSHFILCSDVNIMKLSLVTLVKP